ncbi:hypothetical protein THAOC_37464 [Thalassiosira oceanica]|uniref:Uncharacterized protein n=1 Tax=Thalassiosira oceanica TaxID=159749 RepID=K0R047_THAOC|nr:hypothetical protein THAOC_37464 [Thalassiosira oceanica]|eukprot:EJK44034.1 hypothetical protein THAOC_37464 [Thalassiosira oceanica]
MQPGVDERGKKGTLPPQSSDDDDTEWKVKRRTGAELGQLSVDEGSGPGRHRLGSQRLYNSGLMSARAEEPIGSPERRDG